MDEARTIVRSTRSQCDPSARSNLTLILPSVYLATIAWNLLAGNVPVDVELEGAALLALSR